MLINVNASNIFALLNMIMIISEPLSGIAYTHAHTC